MLRRASSELAVHEGFDQLLESPAELEHAGQVDSDQVQNIDFILEEVGRIDRLIGDLMNVVRISDLIYEQTELESILKSAIVSMKDLSEERGVKIPMINMD